MATDLTEEAREHARRAATKARATNPPDDRSVSMAVRILDRAHERALTRREEREGIAQ